jgi:hypothetical protein
MEIWRQGQMDHEKRSARSKPLTVDDLEAIRILFGFHDVDEFIKFVAAQQEKAENPRRVTIPEEEHVPKEALFPATIIPKQRPSMVYGSGRA